MGVTFALNRSIRRQCHEASRLPILCTVEKSDKNTHRGG
jgi:hypothetical protein